jgi:hypothetical protein
VGAQTFQSLAEHPNAEVIRDVVTRVAQISDRELVALAESWRDSPDLAAARSAALSADAPLVLEALAAFDALTEVFADDLSGKPWAAPIQAPMVRIALKAVRDAIAAAYARPVLHPKQYAALMAPWQQVFPRPGSGRADLGPRPEDVARLLTLLTELAARCHDDRAALAFDRTLAAARARDQEFLSPARADAWSAALLTGRRRTRTVLRRSARLALLRPCSVCGCRPDPDDVAAERVLALAADALDGLLVADAIDTTMLEMLVLPLSTHLDAP